jgi:hypothetical protein
VPGVLERSRSGDGAHVWVFFDGLVPATRARALGAALLRQAISARAELDLAPVDIRFTGSLRTKQAVAVAELVPHELGVLVAPPGRGRP